MELYNRGVLSKHYSSATQGGSSKLLLHGEVLVQSDTVSEIDPLLFAVPVPLLQAERRSDPGGPRGVSVKNSLHLDAWENLFPTSDEIQSLGSDSKIRKYVHKVLVKLSKKRWPKSQLRDFNLLLCLQDLIEANEFGHLCDAIRDPDHEALPKQIMLALDILKGSLIDDEEDDDEL